MNTGCTLVTTREGLGLGLFHSGPFHGMCLNLLVGHKYIWIAMTGHCVFCFVVGDYLLVNLLWLVHKLASSEVEVTRGDLPLWLSYTVYIYIYILFHFSFFNLLICSGTRHNPEYNQNNNLPIFFIFHFIFHHFRFIFSCTYFEFIFSCTKISFMWRCDSKVLSAP